MQWYERLGLAKFITLYVIAHGYAFFCLRRRRFKWRGLEEREVVARGFGFIFGEIRTLLEEVRMRFTGGVVVLDLWSSVQ